MKELEVIHEWTDGFNSQLRLVKYGPYLRSVEELEGERWVALGHDEYFPCADELARLALTLKQVKTIVNGYDRIGTGIIA